MKDPMTARTRLGAWWAARRWAAKVDEPFERIPTPTDDELREHVWDILTDPHESPASGCIPCVLAERRGIWADLGFPHPFDEEPHDEQH